MVEKFVAWLVIFTERPGWRQAAIVAGALLAALLVRILFARVIFAFTGRTAMDIDDLIARALRRPIVWSIAIAGAAWAFYDMQASPAVNFVVFGVLVTLVGLLWAVAAMRVGRILLTALSHRVDAVPWIEEPVFSGRVLDALNSNVYRAFAAAGIEIPYAKHDVYIKELPQDG